MPGDGIESKLWPKIRGALLNDAFTPSQKFLPVDFIHRYITEEAIKPELPRKWKLTHRSLPSQVITKDARKVFAVLVYIGEPAAIRELVVEGLSDSHLPLSVSPTGQNDSILVSSDGKKTFESFSKWKSEQRVTAFMDKQWSVLAPVFDSTGKHLELDPRCPLPFQRAEEVKGNHSSVVYKSVLHAAHFNGTRMNPDKKELQVAVKDFANAAAAFEQERSNLDIVQNLENNENIITHLCTFKRGKNHYVVFPWADGGDLNDFWEKNDSNPRTPDVALWSLQQMSRLTSALQSLHSKNCRHGDLKPDNILHFTAPKGLGKLVVADVGISRTHLYETYLRNTATTTRATTPLYEAPERITSQEPRSRRYDVWSLGCIFLEFVLWFLHDFEAVSSLSDARGAPFYVLTPDQKRAHIHPVVSKAIDLLRQDERCKVGTALEKLIKLIADHLLQIEVKDRDEVDKVVRKLEEIVEEAEANLNCIFNSSATPPGKLRFDKYAQMGARVFENPTIPE